MRKWLKASLVAFCVISVAVGVTDRIQNKDSRHRPGFYEKYIKRTQDFWCSLVAFVILSPVMIITALMVKYKLGSPVLFKQKRPGKNEKIFELYKFRTMMDERDDTGDLLPDEARLTDFGKALRATSIDELPELINIIRGEMSIVGPRPLLVEYLPRYSQEQRHRHDVRPGLTGMAQVSGRNGISWEERFEEDCNYVKNITFLTDWNIIFKTVISVLKRTGIHSNTSVTMEKFQGTKIR